jgi:hypothetical protein
LLFGQTVDGIDGVVNRRALGEGLVAFPCERAAFFGIAFTEHTSREFVPTAFRVAGNRNRWRVEQQPELDAVGDASKVPAQALHIEVSGSGDVQALALLRWFFRDRIFGVFGENSRQSDFEPFGSRSRIRSGKRLAVEPRRVDRHLEHWPRAQAAAQSGFGQRHPDRACHSAVGKMLEQQNQFLSLLFARLGGGARSSWLTGPRRTSQRGRQ